MPKNTTVPVCPHCDNIYDFYWVDSSELMCTEVLFGTKEHTLRCENCGREFKCAVRIRRTFSTEKIGD